MPEQGNKAVQVNNAPQKQGKIKTTAQEKAVPADQFFIVNSILGQIEPSGEPLSPPVVGALRGVLGNRAISLLLERQRDLSLRGEPQAEQFQEGDQSIGGLELVTEPEATVSEAATPEEAEADVNRPVASVVGNVVGAAAAALSGLSISSTTNAGPTWASRGRFNWQVSFSTTGRSGWIVQEVTNTERAEDAEGLDVIEEPASPHYYEAWAVDGTGKVTPSDAGDNDFWTNPPYASGSHGHWSTTGLLFFTKTDPATQGFTRRNPHTNAGILLSSTSAPSGMGMARLSRYAQGTWDSTGAHTGSAG